MDKSERLFQLHHTGIKTSKRYKDSPGEDYFNCTIQELKHIYMTRGLRLLIDFNCTIQELKHFS